MAKIQNPYGLRPIRRIDGLPFAGQMRHFQIESGYDADIYDGDIVAISDAGYLVRVAATSTFPVGTVGVFKGVHLNDAGTIPALAPFQPSWVADTVDPKAMGYVIDDPGVAFQIQADDTLDLSALGKCFDIVHPNGDPRLYSGIALDASSVGTTGPLKVIDFVQGVDSKIGDAYTDVIVKFNPNAHAYLNGTGVS